MRTFCNMKNLPVAGALALAACLPLTSYAQPQVIEPFPADVAYQAADELAPGEPATRAEVRMELRDAERRGDLVESWTQMRYNELYPSEYR